MISETPFDHVDATSFRTKKKKQKIEQILFKHQQKKIVNQRMHRVRIGPQKIATFNSFLYGFQLDLQSK